MKHRNMTCSCRCTRREQATETAQKITAEMRSRVWANWDLRGCTVREIGRMVGLSDRDVCRAAQEATREKLAEARRDAFRQGRLSLMPQPVVVIRRAA